MIACAASPGQLFAAPFAILGSIGVVSQIVNIHRTLQGFGVEPLVFRAGKDKAPLSTIGEVTEAGMTAVQNIVDNTQRAFKRHVVDSRPVLRDVIDHLATGDVWLGYDALNQGLIDRIVTSDEYIGQRLQDGARVLKLSRLVASKYPFLPPTHTTYAHADATGPFSGVLSNTVSGFLRGCLGVIGTSMGTPLVQPKQTAG